MTHWPVARLPADGIDFFFHMYIVNGNVKAGNNRLVSSWRSLLSWHL